MNTLILAAGIPESGSNWLFSVLRFAFINAKIRTYSDLDTCYKPATVAAAHVVKVLKHQPELAEKSHFVFTTFRDIREVAAVLVRRNCVENAPEALASRVYEIITGDYMPWRDRTDLEVNYRDIQRNPHGVVAQILKVLGLETVDPLQVSRDVQKLMRMTRAGEPSQILPDNIIDASLGSYRNYLSDASIEAIEEVCAPWLVTHGYELDTLHLRRTYGFAVNEIKRDREVSAAAR